MNATIDKIGQASVFTVSTSAIDAGNCADFKRDMNAVIEDKAQVVLNLENVDFVDSAGLGSIVWGLKQLNNFGGDLRLCGINPAVRTLFELVRMHKLVRVFDSLDDAVDSINI